MSKYLITLQPLGKYFFGGDMTFQMGFDEKSDFNRNHEGFLSYIIESMKFPQQTSLLGMMRYLLLTRSPEAFSREQDKITSTDKAHDLIGEESFKVNAKHDLMNNFGKIASLSPCVLMKDGEIFLPAPKDYHFKVTFTDSSTQSKCNSHTVTVPEIDGFSPKESYDLLYIGTETKRTVKDEEIFRKDIRIGINKNYKGKSDEKSFYKQISYRLRKGFLFAFSIDCDFNLGDCTNEIVSLGADGSMFALTAKEIPDNKEFPGTYPKEINDNVTNCHRVILLSDSLLTNDDTAHVDFAITDTVPFRFLAFNVHEKNYNFSGGWRRKEKYYLYEKGSVFYFLDEREAKSFADKVSNKCEFHQIGYNYCQEL